MSLATVAKGETSDLVLTNDFCYSALLPLSHLSLLLFRLQSKSH